MKIKITSFDVNEGKIVLHEPDEQNAISIGRDEIPFISTDQEFDRPVEVFLLFRINTTFSHIL